MFPRTHRPALPCRVSSPPIDILLPKRAVPRSLATLYTTTGPAGKGTLVQTHETPDTSRRRNHCVLFLPRAAARAPPSPPCAALSPACLSLPVLSEGMSDSRAYSRDHAPSLSGCLRLDLEHSLHVAGELRMQHQDVAPQRLAQNRRQGLARFKEDGEVPR